MSTIRTNTLSNVAGTQSTAIENAINGSAKAWVNFNGTGTVAIRQSYNVSSITDLGAGQYRVNLTNAMADLNYITIANCADSTTNFGVIGPVQTTTSQVSLGAYNFGAFADFTFISVSVFR